MNAPVDNTAHRLLRLVRVQRAFAAMALLGVVSIALNVLGPLALGRATDLVVEGTVGRGAEGGVDLGQVSLVLGSALVLYAVSGVCWIAQGRQATKAIQSASSRMRTDVNAKLARLPLSHYEAVGRGEILSRSTNDIDNVAQSLQQTMSQLANSVLLIVGLLIAMFVLSPLLAVVAITVVLTAVGLTRLLARAAKSSYAQQWRSTGDLTAHVEETYDGHTVLTAYNGRDRALTEFREHNAALFRSAYRAQLLTGASQPAMNFVNNLGYVVVAVVGCLRVVSGTMTIGDVQAFIQYSRQLTGPLSQVTGLLGIVQSGMASARRVFELLDAEEEDRAGGSGVLASPVRGKVRFESVGFRYRPDEPLIEDLDLTVEAGQRVAIVGETGAGKSTLVNLLLRFRETTAGRITLDGVDIASVPRSDLRSVIASVPQEVWLFSGTIADNIGYGKEAATRGEVEAAAAAAHADHFIRTTPSGFDSVVDGERNGLSLGERQLITIARAFIGDPAILVLDEATSSVDTRTEVLVRRAMDRLTAGRTSFIIAHRLSTIRDADLILVMREGAVVERGRHPDLMAAGGDYEKLYRSQFTEPVDGECRP